MTRPIRPSRLHSLLHYSPRDDYQLSSEYTELSLKENEIQICEPDNYPMDFVILCTNEQGLDRCFMLRAETVDLKNEWKKSFEDIIESIKNPNSPIRHRALSSAPRFFGLSQSMQEKRSRCDFCKLMKSLYD